jgi:cytochrome c oxidase subunit 2
VRGFRRQTAAVVSASVLLAAGAARLLHSADGKVDVVVSKGGFRPDTLRVHKGETLRLHVTSADGEHCFAVDELRVEKRVLPGRPTLVELTPDRAGSFDFYCCLETEAARGRLIVSE